MTVLSFISGAHNSLFLKHVMALINVREYNKQSFNYIFTLKYSFFSNSAAVAQKHVFYSW